MQTYQRLWKDRGNEFLSSLSKIALSNLSPSEDVVCASKGVMGRRDGLLILTDRRVLRAHTMLGQRDVMSIPLDKVEESRYKGTSLMPGLELQRARKWTKILAPDEFLTEIQSRV